MMSDLLFKVMKKNWFTLDEDSFLWLKCNRGLVYNAKNNKKVFFEMSKSIEKICEQLLKTENLYTAELTDDVFKNIEANQWINSLISINAGYLSLHVEPEKKPVSLKPILKVQNKKEYYVSNHDLGLRGEVLENLHELTFYINGSKYGNDDFFKQHLFPMKNCKIQDSSIIVSFIANSRNPFLTNINIVGNFITYPDFKNFIVNISDFSTQFTLHIMIQDFLDNITQIQDFNWPDHFRFNIIVDSDFDDGSGCGYFFRDRKGA